MQVFRQVSFQIIQNRSGLGDVIHRDRLVETKAIIERKIEGSITYFNI